MSVFVAFQPLGCVIVSFMKAYAQIPLVRLRPGLRPSLQTAVEFCDWTRIKCDSRSIQRHTFTSRSGGCK